jgi:di/tricarboxylate transporter
VSGALVLDMVDDTSVSVSAPTLFFASFAFNLLLSVLTFALLRKRTGGRALISTDAATDESAADPEPAEDHRAGVTWRQALTLGALVILVVGALVFDLQIGFLALAAGAVLALVDMKNQEKAVDGIGWSTILLVAGMMTYVAMLEHAGTIELISEHVANVGAPLIVALLLCFTVAVTSAFASSTAILTAIIPIAVPLLLSSHLSPAGLIAALAISTTIVDTSPFSTNGALVLSNARGVDRERFYRQVIGYTFGIVGLGPALAWSALVLVPWTL